MKKLFFLSVLFFIFSCQTQKKTAKQQDEKTYMECELMRSLTEDTNVPVSDPFLLDSLAITKNCLEVFVSYSGGCGDAEFILYNTNRLMESMPPQTSLLLHFKDEDPCRAIVQDTLYFDLSSFREVASSGGIWLKIRGSDKKVLYKN